MDILVMFQFIGACTVVAIIGFFLAHLLDDTREMDEAERRHRGILLQDETQAAELMRRYNECRERMGKDCCLHPEYRFNEKHRQIVGRE